MARSGAWASQGCLTPFYASVAELMFSPTGCMQLQVHSIVEQPQNLDVALTLAGSNAEQHKVSALVTVSCHVERKQPFADLTAFPCTRRHRPSGQRPQSCRKRVRVCARLPISELSQHPNDDALEV